MGEQSNTTEGVSRLQALAERFHEGEKSLIIQRQTICQNVKILDEKQAELGEHRRANNSQRDILDEKESLAEATEQQVADLERVVHVQHQSQIVLFSSLTESEQVVSEQERELMDGTREFVKEVMLRVTSGLRSRAEMRAKLGKDVLLSTK
jgi:hypothetical protein